MDPKNIPNAAHAFRGSPVASIVDPVNGQPWTLRLVRQGQAYGRSGDLNASRAKVEFYDARYPDSNDRFGHLGQFVSRYYRDTLGRRGYEQALDLNGGVPDWKLSGAAMSLVHDLLNNWGVSE